MITRYYFFTGTYTTKAGLDGSFWKVQGHRSLFPNPVSAIKAKLLSLEAEGCHSICLSKIERIK